MRQNALQLLVEYLVNKRGMALENQCSVIPPKTEMLMGMPPNELGIVATKNHWLKKPHVLPQQVFPNKIHKRMTANHWQAQ
jgi:hypothetical protein